MNGTNKNNSGYTGGILNSGTEKMTPACGEVFVVVIITIIILESFHMLPKGKKYLASRSQKSAEFTQY